MPIGSVVEAPLLFVPPY